MTEVLRPNLNRKGKRGRQGKLSVEAQLLLVLEHGRVSSYSIPPLIREVKTLLMGCAKWRLPGKKPLPLILG